MEWSHGVESWSGAMEWSFGVDFGVQWSRSLSFVTRLGQSDGVE